VHMENRKPKIYTVRVEVAMCLGEVWEDFNHAIETFERETNVKLNFNYWYDSKNDRRKDLAFIEKIESYTPITNSVIFDIRKHTDDPSSIQSCKYYFLYTDANTFISKVFELLSFIKAMLNYEEQKNDNRYDRKQTFRKKARDKRLNVDVQTAVSGST